MCILIFTILQVYKAVSGESYVAVKIFQSGHQEFENWTREKDLYQTPGLLEHDNILKFISAEIRQYNVTFPSDFT